MVKVYIVYETIENEDKTVYVGDFAAGDVNTYVQLLKEHGGYFDGMLYTPHDSWIDVSDGAFVIALKYTE